MFRILINDKKYPIAIMQDHYILYDEKKGLNGRKWCWDKKCEIKSGFWEIFFN